MRTSSLPAAGPLNAITVLAVIRRLRRERSTCHPPRPRLTSTTLTPWAACDLRTMSAVYAALAGRA